MKKRNFIIFSLLTLSFLFIAPILKADDFNTTKKVHITPEQLVAENLYLVSEEIIIDGKVAGDLIAVAQRIEINGEITGDLIALATEIEINGRVEGNVRAAANVFSVNGSVAKNINIFSQEIYLNPGSFIGWDIVGSGNIVFLKGVINGSANIVGENVFLETTIKKNAELRLRGELTSLNILAQTVIEGNLKYFHNEELLSINKDNVKGNIEFNHYQKNENEGELISIILMILAAIISTLFFVYILKGINKKTILALKTFSLKDLLPTLLFLVVIPIISVLLLISIIGIPLALLVITFYLIIIYLAKIVAVIFVSDFLFEKLKMKKNFILFLLLGITISWLIFALPYVGNIAATLAVLFGLSGLIKYVKNQSCDI